MNILICSLFAKMKSAMARVSGSEKARGPAYTSVHGLSLAPTSFQWKSKLRFGSTPRHPKMDIPYGR